MARIVPERPSTRHATCAFGPRDNAGHDPAHSACVVERLARGQVRSSCAGCSISPQLLAHSSRLVCGIIRGSPRDGRAAPMLDRRPLLDRDARVCRPVSLCHPEAGGYPGTGIRHAGFSSAFVGPWLRVAACSARKRTPRRCKPAYQHMPTGPLDAPAYGALTRRKSSMSSASDFTVFSTL